jgi:hypothetical protein
LTSLSQIISTLGINLESLSETNEVDLQILFQEAKEKNIISEEVIGQIEDCLK